VANLYNGNPVILDSTMISPSKLLGATTTNRYHIENILWDNPATTPADTVVLQDQSGNVIYSATVASQKGPLNFTPPFVVEDFKLVTLAEGKLYIYLSNVAQ
jgi:hypothetical protein